MVFGSLVGKAELVVGAQKEKNGATAGTRTRDQLIKSQLLYH